jgi:hypothetical protein
MSVRTASWLAAVWLIPTLVSGEVARVDITARHDVLGGRPFGSAGVYELLVGRVYFVVDPAAARNQVVADLDKAPRNAAGQVEFSADLSILRPKDPAHASGVALIDIVNRGTKTVLTSFDRAGPSRDLTTDAEFGDGFLLRQGYTIIWIGWEFDIAARPGVTRIEVPAAKGVTGTIRATFTPEAKEEEYTVRDLSGYAPLNPDAADSTLTVRDGFQGTPLTIPRARWRIAGNVVTLEGAFEPGRTYEVAFAAANPPVSGLGFAAIRDAVSWLKRSSDTPVTAKYAYAFGNSQSGRFLRDFLYHGFNTDEHNQQVFDAVIANVAGASRTDVNRRWATPIGLGANTATSFPFADTRQRDPVTGAEEGALDNIRARDHQPKIFYTNTGVEYWGGGRAAALIHTAPDGSRDLALPDNVRLYVFAGAQHSPARFPSALSVGQQKDNPNNYWWTMRALLVAMDKWVRDRVGPPASRYPRLQDGTLVSAVEVPFPSIPSVASPRMLPAPRRGSNPLVADDGAPGATLPYLVPQVDQDGNERAGIRLPDVAVPLGTYTGWNFRKASIGASGQLYPLLGSYIPFAGTKAERERTRDPRESIEERYPSRERYLALTQEAASALTRDRYLLPEDVPAVMEHAGEHWDLLMHHATAATK